MIEKLKNLKENFEPNIDAVKFSQNLPKIKRLFLIEFMVMLVIFLSLFFLKFTDDTNDLAFIVALFAISLRLIFQKIIYYHAYRAKFGLNMENFLGITILFAIITFTISFIVKPFDLKFLYFTFFVLSMYLKTPVFHKNQISLFSISKNYAFVISTIFSYICIGLFVPTCVIVAFGDIFSSPNPLEDLWLVIIIILSALLASAFDLIGICTMKFKKASKVSVYTHFGVVYILAFALWVGLIMLPEILEKSNYHLFRISKELFIKLFF